LAAVVEANASQSFAPPSPFVSVVVTLAPGATLAALTVRLGGGLIVKVCGADVPPPGAGVKTVTCAVPTEARSVAGIVARTCVVLTNVVVRFTPFHWITDADANPLPVAVNVNVAAPAGAVVGEIAVSTGLGYGRTVTVALVAART
jgi:hypothetical protein